jgi:transcriptional regulator with GAF, ATPase, and Fis domain
VGDAELTCAVHAGGPGDALLAGCVAQDLSRRGVIVADISGGAPPEAPTLFVCAVPDESSPKTVAQLARNACRVLVVVGPCPPSHGLTWELLSHGASDIMSWRPEDQPGAAVRSRLQRWSQIDETVAAPFVRQQLVGRSSAWLAALRRAVEIAYFATSSLLLVGESGTGKELAARLFHHLDPRRDKGDLIVVDCTTIVPTLSGSELFGHERGAFTGAMSAREGAFAAADRGTLFLDEVGELPLMMQAELLRVVQEGTYKRVGSDRWRTTRFRLVCATNRDLAAELAAGRFRLDLFHRLAANVVRLPPLRERPGDVLPLFTHFLAEAVGSDLELHPAVAEFVERRDYPGNVRDLRQLALRIAVRHVGAGPVTPGDVPDEERPAAGTAPVESAVESAVGAPLVDQVVAAALRDGCGYRDIRNAAGEAAVRLAVESAGGDLMVAARQLGVTRRMLEQRRALARDDTSAMGWAERSTSRSPTSATARWAD